jgi:(p)ppGpp synthase/HD superfamily hydrolase
MSAKLSDRFSAAFSEALRLHQNQQRKATGTPYIAHLMSVAALVLENGGSEDQAIAALLHDAVEDAGGLDTLHAIREQFGPYVAELVDGCTDSYTQPKGEWKPRKEAYLDKLQIASDDVKLISLADKVHNARSILRDLQYNGESAWDKFTGEKKGTIWYYQTLAEIFQGSPYPMLSDELIDLVERIQTLSTSLETNA